MDNSEDTVFADVIENVLSGERVTENIPSTPNVPMPNNTSDKVVQPSYVLSINKSALYMRRKSIPTLNICDTYIDGEYVNYQDPSVSLESIKHSVETAATTKEQMKVSWGLPLIYNSETKRYYLASTAELVYNARIKYINGRTNLDYNENKWNPPPLNPDKYKISPLKIWYEQNFNTEKV